MISCDEVYYTPTYYDDLVRDPLMMANVWTDIPGVMPWLPSPPHFVATADTSRLRSACGTWLQGFRGRRGALHRRAEPARRARQRSTVPDYYGANCAAFEDCISDLLREEAGAAASSSSE